MQQLVSAPGAEVNTELRVRHADGGWRRIVAFGVSDTTSSTTRAMPACVVVKRVVPAAGKTRRARSSAARFCAAQVATSR